MSRRARNRICFADVRAVVAVVAVFVDDVDVEVKASRTVRKLCRWRWHSAGIRTRHNGQRAAVDGPTPSISSSEHFIRGVCLAFRIVFFGGEGV